METMSSGGKKKGPAFDSPQQQAWLQLWRTYDRLKALEDQLFGSFEISSQQYNLLRLLEAASPDPLRTLDLARRMISRSPDITRMLDRLESQGWIARDRPKDNRRTVLVSITPAGLRLLQKIARPLAECHQQQLGHLGKDSLSELVRLLKAAGAPHEPEGSPWGAAGGADPR
jgi:DNA-binding MarR family transcriptional regulator